MQHGMIRILHSTIRKIPTIPSAAYFLLMRGLIHKNDGPMGTMRCCSYGYCMNDQAVVVKKKRICKFCVFFSFFGGLENWKRAALQGNIIAKFRAGSGMSLKVLAAQNEYIYKFDIFWLSGSSYRSLLARGRHEEATQKQECEAGLVYLQHMRT